MTDKKIVVPSGMKLAALAGFEGSKSGPWEAQMSDALEAALRWLSENPIVPTDGQVNRLQEQKPDGVSWIRWTSVEYQRRMFLAPEPEAPEEVKDLIWDLDHTGWQTTGEKHNKEIAEAFRRGQNSTK